MSASLNLDLSVLDKVRKAAERAVKDSAEFLLEEANRTIPIDTGAMQRSGQVTTKGTQAAASYDTPYAARQHEDTRLRHADGRKAKWLEDTATAEHDRIVAFMGDTIKKALA